MRYKALAGSVTIAAAAIMIVGAGVALGGHDRDSDDRGGTPKSTAGGTGVVHVGCVASGQVRGRGKNRIPDPETDLIAGPFAIVGIRDPYWADRPELFERKPGRRYAGLKDGALLKAGNVVTVTVPGPSALT